MGDISEKTRVVLNIGGVALIVALVFGAGRFWGTWSSDNRHRDEAIARHEGEIKELREAIGEVHGTLREIKTAQDTSRESTAATVRNTTFLIDKLGQLEVALAERGIRANGD